MDAPTLNMFLRPILTVSSAGETGDIHTTSWKGDAHNETYDFHIFCHIKIDIERVIFQKNVQHYMNQIWPK